VQVDPRARPEGGAKSEAPSTLRLEQVSRRFGTLEVLHGLDLELAAGQRGALLGPNGSGKSTVLRLVAGTLHPTEGRVTVGGHPAGSLPARRLLGVSLAQERSFYLRLTGRQNLEFFGRMRGMEPGAAAAAVRDLEEELEIDRIAPKRVDRCSTGMVQQLAFARALLGEPDLLLLDEPTRSLDAGARDRLWAALDRRPEVALLIATHRDDDLEHCQVRVALG
jgi:ABC-type multidrug transport system ATPase subunit